jgi:DNA-binding HxlR family transcriptional regulator
MAGGNGVPLDETSVGSTLKFLGGGATGPILMALGPRPLRTKKLTERVPRYTPRTVYRHARTLSDQNLVDRQETPGVPSSVIHSLSIPSGRELFRLLDAYAEVALPRLDASRNGDGIWASIGLIGEMWESGWTDELSRGGQTATDLSEATAGLTFHQTSRRTQQMISWGLLSKGGGPGQRKRYQLTEQARQGMALIAGVGRWRQRHVPGDERGLTVPEMAVVLRACLPLIALPGHPGMSIKLGIVGAPDAQGDNGSETLSGNVGMDGSVRSVRDKAKPDSWALCTVDAWFAAILDGNRGRMRVGGDLDLVDHCLKQLYDVLWTAPVDLPLATLN